jgi:hypothetical protein
LQRSPTGPPKKVLSSILWNDFSITYRLESGGISILKARRIICSKK